jgi:hypothetical protein
VQPFSPSSSSSSSIRRAAVLAQFQQLLVDLQAGQDRQLRQRRPLLQRQAGVGETVVAHSLDDHEALRRRQLREDSFRERRRDPDVVARHEQHHGFPTAARAAAGGVANGRVDLRLLQHVDSRFATSGVTDRADVVEIHRPGQNPTGRFVFIH